MRIGLIRSAITARPARLPKLAAIAFFGILCSCSPESNTWPVGSSRSVEFTSKQVERYYADYQSRLLAKGFLRTDGGTPDEAVSAESLTRNFENIAMYNEFVRSRGSFRPGRRASTLRRWTKPVRILVTFGDSVSEKRRIQDLESIEAYVNRLQRLTGHSIALSERDPNFHVIIMNSEEMRTFAPALRVLAPTIPPGISRDLLNSSLQTFCLAYSDYRIPQSNYESALVLIKSEHPNLTRLSCIHEEMAQALGLTNDYSGARPSIFNDDEEFALLTRHDEMLLKILYDPRLPTGASKAAARPIIREIAHELVSGSF